MDISESSNYRDFVWAIELNRLSLGLIGLWPKTDKVVKRRLGSDIRAGFAFIMIGFISGIPLVHALMRVWGDMALMIDNLRITLPVLAVLLEFVIMRWKQTVIFVIVLPYFNLPIRHLTNLTDRNKPLPLQTYYLYDTDKSLQFELTFLSQAIATFLAILIHIAVNAFLGFLILHICGQLENFKHRVINLISCKDFNTALSSSIVTHLRLI
ncbi:odorant receptor 13a, partial [Lasius niger]